MMLLLGSTSTRQRRLALYPLTKTLTSVLAHTIIGLKMTTIRYRPKTLGRTTGFKCLWETLPITSRAYPEVVLGVAVLRCLVK